jgi:acyl carrier protein
MQTSESVQPVIREISRMMAETLLVEVGSPEDDLLATGALDSLNLIQLLVNLEKHFGIRIPLDELQIEDVRSIESMARLVETYKRAHANAKGA